MYYTYIYIYIYIDNCMVSFWEHLVYKQKSFQSIHLDIIGSGNAMLKIRWHVPTKWRYGMGKPPVLMTHCEEILPVTRGFPSRRANKRFDAFFVVRSYLYYTGCTHHIAKLRFCEGMELLRIFVDVWNICFNIYTWCDVYICTVWNKALHSDLNLNKITIKSAGDLRRH